MKSITAKHHVHAFINAFILLSTFDDHGKKHYLVFSDKNRGGQLTLMRYPDQTWSFHGVGDSYCDPEETYVTTDELQHLVWEHRAAINRKLKEKVLGGTPA